MIRRTSCVLIALALGCGGELASSDIPAGGASGLPAVGGRGSSGGSAPAGGARTSGGDSTIGAVPATGGAVAAGGSGPSAGSATGGTIGLGGAVATGGADSICYDVSSQVQPAPPVLEFVIDVSQSMGDPAYPGTSNSATKWQEVKRWLPSALSSLPPTWAVGITFFSQPDTGCYLERQSLPIAGVTSVQLALVDLWTASQVPAGQRPTLVAWRQGLTELTGWLAPTADYAESPRFLVLFTDGSPTVNGDGCTPSIPITEAEYDAEIAAVAEEGVAAGVQTFVVGLPGSADPLGASYDPLYLLSSWAVAGGTPEPPGCVPTSGVPSGTGVDPRGTYCHLDLTTNADFVTGLTQALDSIRTRVSGCSFAVPPPPDTFVYDPVDLIYSPGSGSPRLLTRASSSACIDGQWYVIAWDSHGYATLVALCPGTCSAVAGDPSATLAIEYFCLSRLD